jgi:choice-of-anchor A domain-containing protein
MPRSEALISENNSEKFLDRLSGIVHNARLTIGILPTSMLRIPTMTPRRVRLRTLLAVGLASITLGSSHAWAQPINLGQAANYAYFVLGTDGSAGISNQSSINNSSVNGPMAFASGTTYNWSGGGGPYTGPVFYQTGQPTPPVASLGGPTPTAVATNLNPAVADALSAASQVQALTATQTLSAITVNGSDQTINSSGPGAVNVIDVPSITINNHSLILNGDANSYFIIRLTGTSGTVFHASGGGITLTGGIPANHVLYYTGATNVTVNGPNGQFSGTFLAPNTSTNFDNITINGAVIAARATTATGNLTPTLVSGVHLNYVPFGIPEPSSTIALGTALGGLALYGWRRRQKAA